MTDDWKIQVSIKTQMGSMINCRADSPIELDNELSAVLERIPQILTLEQQVFAGGTVAQQVPLAPQQPAPQPQQWQQPAQPAAPQWANQTPAPLPAPVPAPGGFAAPASTGASGAGPLQQPGVVCKHGIPAKYKEPGISKKTGNPYKAAWTCPMDQANSCGFWQTV